MVDTTAEPPDGARAAPTPVPARAPARRDEDWTDGATDQAIAIAIEQRDKENPPGEGDSISGSLMGQVDGGELGRHRTKVGIALISHHRHHTLVRHPHTLVRAWRVTA